MIDSRGDDKGTNPFLLLPQLTSHDPPILAPRRLAELFGFAEKVLYAPQLSSLIALGGPRGEVCLECEEWESWSPFLAQTLLCVLHS